jgi:hypothetical protein
MGVDVAGRRRGRQLGRGRRAFAGGSVGDQHARSHQHAADKGGNQDLGPEGKFPEALHQSGLVRPSGGVAELRRIRFIGRVGVAHLDVLQGGRGREPKRSGRIGASLDMAKNRRPGRLIVVLNAAVRSCRRRGRNGRGRRCRPRWTGNGRGPWRPDCCGGRDGGGRRRGVITGPSAGGDHDDDDGGDDDRRGRDGYPPAPALLLGTIVIRPLRSVPVALDLDIARPGPGTSRRAEEDLLAGVGRYLGSAPSRRCHPSSARRGRLVRICVPTWLSPFDQVNSSSTAARPRYLRALDGVRQR